MVKFTQKSLGDLRAALLTHAERLKSLLKPSWPNAEKVHEEMYKMVDTLMIHVVDQKWFSAFANIGGTEEMVMSQEIRVVSWGGSFCNFAIPLTKCFLLSPSPQTMGSALINCINAAHEKYELNAMEWEQVIVTGWCLSSRADMGRFGKMCKDGLSGLSDYGIFEDWVAVDWSREGYLCIRDGLVSEGEIQEMEDEKNRYDKGLYKARVHAFFLAYHQMRACCCWLSFHPADLEHYREFEVSLE